MMDKKKASAAHMKATEKYEDLNYDKILVRFPAGTKERLLKTKESANGYITKAVLDKLDEEKIFLSDDELNKVMEEKKRKRENKEQNAKQK